MLTDAVLVDRVIAGFDDAFEELYRRHSAAAWRLGQAVTGNSHDAADAVSEAFARVLQAVRSGRLENGESFRSYLLTATRNAALDGMRRAGKANPTADEHLDLASPAPSPAEKVTGAVDAVLVAEAFRNLPERWRSVLWLTEVEGVATKDAADQLGMSANGTAQLAVRARAGLRERYLQAHVRNHARPECRFTYEHLGAYVGGGISPRDLAKVDQHLAGCADCRARKEEIEELGSTLRRIVLPVPLTLGALSAGKVHTVLTASSTAAPAGLSTRALQLAKEPTPLMRKVVGASAAGVLALGLLSLGLVTDGDDRVAGLAAPKGDAATVELPDPVVDPLPERFSDSFARGSASYALPRRTAAAPSGAVSAPAPSTRKPAAATTPAPKPQTRPQASPLPVPVPVPVTIPEPLCALPLVGGLCPSTDGTDPAPEPTLPLPDVNVGANLLEQKVGVAVGVDDPAVSVVAGPIEVGEPTPATPEEEGVVATIGDTTIKLP